jgi:UDP-glucose 4-epimerase
MKVLVTGGAGYIGAHICHKLSNLGFQVRVLDDFSTGRKERIGEFKDIIEGSILDKEILSRAVIGIDAVIHLAAKKSVEESVHNPIKYVENNLIGTINLAAEMLKANCKKIVFSSTAALYSPKFGTLDEDDTKEPLSPYGLSKLWAEESLKDLHKLGLRSVSLRYFNVAGAAFDYLGDNSGDNLVPKILEAASKQLPVQIYGSDYETSDGTCIRDFIHVEDLAEAHIKALNYLEENEVADVFNVGSGTGFSVKQVVERASLLSKNKIDYRFAHRRDGDVPFSVASTNKIEKVLGWKPKLSLKDILESSFNAWRAEKGSL